LKPINQQKEADVMVGISSENELLKVYNNKYKKPLHVHATYVLFLGCSCASSNSFG